ncbi:hypothetical protein ACIPPM_14430 [Streptomyces sp. NPDC090119]|uniref:hypothetical protein n=1 Tax=Streptomyces sp. NPDC090119 TaxID=3365951 RepID=UPI0037F3B82A
MVLLGLPELSVDAPVAHDADHRGQDQEGQDAEGGDHSDETLDLVSVHVISLALNAAVQHWQDCRKPSNSCQCRGTLAAC